ncbi:hypothetical protein ABK040_000200 [Willaertia magna]
MLKNNNTNARSYQLELFEQAKHENIAVVLDTGTGKTLISILLIHHVLFSEHLENNNIETNNENFEEENNEEQIQEVGDNNKEEEENRKVKIRKMNEDKKIVFIADNRVLVMQQTEAIKKGLKNLILEDYMSHSKIDEMVGCYMGDSGMLGEKLVKSESFKQKKVIVTTAQFLYNLLLHNLFQMENISLLIIDECHHLSGDHPYRTIMNHFYHSLKEEKRPKIFGMTASAINLKMNDLTEDQEHKLLKLKSQLEYDLDCKLKTIVPNSKLYEELKEYVNEPEERVEMYNSNELVIDQDFIKDLEEKVICVCVEKMLMIPNDNNNNNNSSFFSSINNNINKNNYYNSPRNHPKFRTFVSKLRDDVLELYNDFGSWSIVEFFNYLLDSIAKKSLGMSLPINEEEDNELLNEIFDSYNEKDCQLVIDNSKLKEDILNLVTNHFKNCCKVTSKVEMLFNLIEKYCIKNDNEDFRALIFCQKRITAILLSRYCEMMYNKKIQCDYLIGHHEFSSSKNNKIKVQLDPMGKNTTHGQREKIKNFREGKTKCLFCTNVVEEGFDVPECNLVIRFDKFADYLRGYIQSRGRARKKDSVYIMMVDMQDDDQKAFCAQRKQLHRKMQELINKETTPFPYIDLNQNVNVGVQEPTYTTSKGAKATLVSGIQLLNRYCSVLPCLSTDERKPFFHTFGDSVSGYTTKLMMPPNCPISNLLISSDSYNYLCPSKVTSKRLSALKAIELLHQHGELDDYLFPIYGNNNSLGIDYDLIEKFDPSLSSKRSVKKLPDIFHWNSIEAQDEGKESEDSQKVYFYDILVNGLPSEFQLLLTKEIDSSVMSILTFDIPKGEELTTFSLKYRNSHFLNKELIENCLEYHEFIFGDITHLMKTNEQEDKSITKALIDNAKFWRCFILPKNPEEHFKDVPLSDFLDNLIIEHENKENREELINETIKRYLIQTKYNKKIYMANRVCFELNPLSSWGDRTRYKNYLEFYKERWNETIVDDGQPLIEAFQPSFKSNNNNGGGNGTIHLVPELTTISSFTKEMFDFIKLVPLFLYKLQNRLLSIEFSNVTNLNQFIKYKEHYLLLEEALTAKRALTGMDYEKLEFLGDSILKFITCEYLYKEFPNASPEHLTKMKHQLVSNQNLTAIALKTNLPSFIITEVYKAKKIIKNNLLISATTTNTTTVVDKEQDQKEEQKEGSSSSSNSTVVLENNEKRDAQMKDKVIADVVESILGFCFICGGFTAVYHFLKFIGYRLPKRKVLEQEQENKFNNRNLLNNNYNFEEKIKTTENILKYPFKNKELLIEALTHPSYNAKFNLERLEFIGDAILDMLVMIDIFNYFFDFKNSKTTISKGNNIPLKLLNDLREGIVKNLTFSKLCFDNKLFINLIAKENVVSNIVTYYKTMNNQKNNTNNNNNKSETCLKILSDIFESIAGAIYIDSNCDLESVNKIYYPLWKDLIHQKFEETKQENSKLLNTSKIGIISFESIDQFIISHRGMDSVASFNEFCQQFIYRYLPDQNMKYKLFKEQSESPIPPVRMFAKHIFYLFDAKVGEGIGPNKKAAKKSAADKSLKYIEDNKEWFVKQLTSVVKQ